MLGDNKWSVNTPYNAKVSILTAIFVWNAQDVQVANVTSIIHGKIWNWQQEGEIVKEVNW